MKEMFENGFRMMKPKAFFENVLLAVGVFVGKTLLDIYYNKDIWLDNASEQTILPADSIEELAEPKE